MLQPRRAFIRSIALASAAIAMRPSGLRAVVSAPRTAAPGGRAGSLDAAAFAALRNALFTVGGADAKRGQVRLVDVRQFQRESYIENFSVHFEGPAEAVLAAGTHRFEHPTVGDFDLFVTARRIDAKTIGYDAIFNRLV